MYQVTSKVDSQWVHLVLNFIGPMERFRLFKDGALVNDQQNKAYTSTAMGNGRLVLGRRQTSRNTDYSTIDVDEVIFFNRKLTGQEEETLYKDK